MKGFLHKIIPTMMLTELITLSALPQVKVLAKGIKGVFTPKASLVDTYNRKTIAQAHPLTAANSLVVSADVLNKHEVRDVVSRLKRNKEALQVSFRSRAVEEVVEAKLYGAIIYCDDSTENTLESVDYLLVFDREVDSLKAHLRACDMVAHDGNLDFTALNLTR